MRDYRATVQMGAIHLLLSWQMLTVFQKLDVLPMQLISSLAENADAEFDFKQWEEIMGTTKQSKELSFHLAQFLCSSIALPEKKPSWESSEDTSPDDFSKAVQEVACDCTKPLLQRRKSFPEMLICCSACKWLLPFWSWNHWSVTEGMRWWGLYDQLRTWGSLVQLQDGWRLSGSHCSLADQRVFLSSTCPMYWVTKMHVIYASAF